ncbi:hypothetical protein X777_04901 [Ooceraea biroi]|uniref:Uncharacterized protein n=1 Tax=Ooceraea biroi TaxID=2015173 RepID=A0A026WF08_OOCBI|nr:hypothetical protein X777_04901 [Ooceraea biroi]
MRKKERRFSCGLSFLGKAEGSSAPLLAEVDDDILSRRGLRLIPEADSSCQGARREYWTTIIRSTASARVTVAGRSLLFFAGGPETVNGIGGAATSHTVDRRAALFFVRRLDAFLRQRGSDRARETGFTAATPTGYHRVFTVHQ